MLEALLEHSAGIEVDDNFGRTPLHMAASGGHYITAGVIVEISQNTAERICCSRSYWNTVQRSMRFVQTDGRRCVWQRRAITQLPPESFWLLSGACSIDNCYLGPSERRREYRSCR